MNATNIATPTHADRPRFVDDRGDKGDEAMKPCSSAEAQPGQRCRQAVRQPAGSHVQRPEEREEVRHEDAGAEPSRLLHVLHRLGVRAMMIDLEGNPEVNHIPEPAERPPDTDKRSQPSRQRGALRPGRKRRATRARCCASSHRRAKMSRDIVEWQRRQSSGPRSRLRRSPPRKAKDRWDVRIRSSRPMPSSSFPDPIPSTSRTTSRRAGDIVGRIPRRQCRLAARASAHLRFRVRQRHIASGATERLHRGSSTLAPTPEMRTGWRSPRTTWVASIIRFTLPKARGAKVTIYPPAMAPTIKNGSFPAATASGSGASGGSCDRSCSQAKRTNGRRRGLP